MNACPGRVSEKKSILGVTFEFNRQLLGLLSSLCLRIVIGSSVWGA